MAQYIEAGRTVRIETDRSGADLRVNYVGGNP
jgi:hypothetical protein